METAQSPTVPALGKKPQWSDLAWLGSYSARGLRELINARIIFDRLHAKEIPQRNRAAQGRAQENQSQAPIIDQRKIARIAYVLPRLSDRLPWRSDCLVQAIAAQNWLSALGAASEIQIGVENPEDGEFGAHAWLIYDDYIVTGGDIDRYELILSESRLGAGKNVRGPGTKP